MRNIITLEQSQRVLKQGLVLVNYMALTWVKRRGVLKWSVRTEKN